MKNNVPQRFECKSPVEVYYSCRKTDSVPHWHTGYLLTLTEDGDGVEIQNGKTYPICKGKLSLLSPSDIHQTSVGKRGFFSHYGVKFRSELFSGNRSGCFAKMSFPLTVYLSEQEYNDAFYLVKMLERESQKNAEQNSGISSSILELLLHLANAHRLAKPDPSSSQISDALAYLQTHFTEQISQAKLASLSGFSTDYFGRIFKRETGISYQSYLLSLRLECAERLLLTGTSVAEACYSAGFSSPSWFSTAFRRHYGASPGEYVLKKREGSF